MAFGTAQTMFSPGRTFWPCLGYGAFTLLLFCLFLGLFHCERSGVEYILSRLGRSAAITAERPELSLFPPRLRLASLTLKDTRGRFPAATLHRPVLSLGLKGFFPPRPALNVNAELGKGDLRMTVACRSFSDWTPETAVFALSGTEAADLGITFPGGKMEGGRISIQGEYGLSAGSPFGTGRAQLTLEQGALDLPFPDPALRFIRNVAGRAEVQWQKNQLDLTSAAFGNDALSLSGGGAVALRGQNMENSVLNVRFALRKAPGTPDIPELYPALARLNAGQAVTLEIGGTLNRPSVTVAR